MSEFTEFYRRRVDECDEAIESLKARRDTLKKGDEERDKITKRLEYVMADKNNYTDALNKQLIQEGVK